MGVLLVFAFISGIITILSPCILPVLPIVLSGGSLGGKARPYGVVSGFVVSFTFFTLALSAIVSALGIPADAMRYVAIVLVVVLGLVMAVPRLREGFELLASRLASRAGSATATARARSGFWGGLPVGLSLGLVWTPCVGPIMASVISLALTRRIDGGSVLIALAYSLGTAIPMLGILLGGKALLRRVPALGRNTARIQRVFGLVMILMGLVLALQWDRKIQAAILQAFPSYGSGLTALEDTKAVKAALEARAGQGGQAAGPVFRGPPSDASPVYSAGQTLGDYGQAPDFVTPGPWLPPSPALDLAALKGKVVLVDFWTYSCINCLRTLPQLRSWYEAYRDKGLVIIGVHSPEFPFERDRSNLARAMRDLGVTWPVVQDNDFLEWQAWGNQYWPAHYLIDASGRVRYWHFGEGAYAETEMAIRSLLSEAGAGPGGSLVSAPDSSLSDRTPETYLGYGRARGFASATKPVADRPVAYLPARTPALAEWNLEGTWTITQQYIEPGPGASLFLGFDAKDVYLVAEPDGPPSAIRVFVDGKPVSDTEDVRGSALAPGTSRLYHLVSLPSGGFHVLRLELKGGVRLFSFTFG
jgi:cytochrome c biogenesis protein CcdA/thiol-disulfide isomerase/thioredoxin